MLHTKLSQSPKSFTPIHEIVYPTTHTRRLLVVADEERAVLAMEAHFSALGWQVDCAFELEEAEALLSCRSYATVVTDLRLSGAHKAAGLQIVTHVRARCPHTSVFLWTSARTPELEAQAHRSGGVDGFLPKRQSVQNVARTVCAASEKNYAQTLSA